jgi:hypothetical protein
MAQSTEENPPARSHKSDEPATDERTAEALGIPNVGIDGVYPVTPNNPFPKAIAPEDIYRGTGIVAATLSGVPHEGARHLDPKEHPAEQQPGPAHHHKKFEDMTLVELRKLAAARGLSAAGNRQVVAGRLKRDSEE